MLKSNLHSPKAPKITRLLSIIPIVLLALGLWSFVYINGYFINAETNIHHMYPTDASYILTLDSSKPGEFNETFIEKTEGDGLTVNFLGDLPKGFRTFTEDGYFVVEGPTPIGTKVHLETTPTYNAFRAVTVSTNDFFGIFGFYPKNMMESMAETVLYVGVALAIGEFLFYRYSKNHKIPTIVDYYKTRILIIKQQTLIMIKH